MWKALHQVIREYKSKHRQIASAVIWLGRDSCKQVTTAQGLMKKWHLRGLVASTDGGVIFCRRL